MIPNCCAMKKRRNTIIVMQMTPHGGGIDSGEETQKKKFDGSLQAVAAITVAILKLFARSLTHIHSPYSIHLPFARVCRPLTVPPSLVLQIHSETDRPIGRGR